MKVHFMIALCGTLAFFGEASAQSCSVGYDRSERARVQASDTRVDRYLARMAELAELSASGAFSLTHLTALDYEFQALMTALRAEGDRNRPRLSVRANTFLNEILDPDYLGLSGLSIRGNTIEASQQLARIALDAVNRSYSSIDSCLAGSWDRVALVGVPDDGQCAGGYNRADRRIVRRELRETEAYLSMLAWLAEDSANGVFSVTQRNIQQFDLEFSREEIELQGRRTFPGVSRRTRSFLRTVIDPTFLGIERSIINGTTIEQSQANARDTLAAVQDALSTLRRCGA